ncbi:MAG: MFS transporter [Candidatus Nanopelagicales bacterium]
MPATVAIVDVRRIATPLVRRLFLGHFLNALGSGLTLALIVVYLHSIRGIPISSATGLLAWQALLGLVLSAPAGTLVDRFGPRPVLLVAILAEALGVLALGRVTVLEQAFAAVTLMAIGTVGIWGPASALTARLVAPTDRPTAFGVSFMLLNLGLGLGGLIGATIVDLADPTTFTLLYTLDASTYLAYFLAVLSLGDVGAMPADAEADEPAADAPNAAGSTGWGEVLRDRALLRFAAAGLMMLTFGYGSIDAGASLFITKFAGLDEHYIGIIFAANTAVIVVMQLFVLSMVAGRSRSRVLAGVAVLWGCSWVLFGLSLGLPEWAAVGLLVAAISVFALGETMWSPVAPALLNDLAPEHLRGRYNSFQSMMWGLSGALGPLLTGAFLSAGRGRLWTLALAAGCGLAALMALGLRRHLTPAQDGLHPAATPPDPG